MDLQDIIFKLDRYWIRQGCSLLPPGADARPAGEEPLCLAGAAGGRGLPPDGLEGLYRYRVSLRPAAAGVRRGFLESLRAAGIDRSEHDLRWLPLDAEPEAPGWEVLLDGQPLARFRYLPAGQGRPAAAEILVSLERLALASQRRKAAADLRWSGRVTYGQLHGEGA